MLPTVLGAGDIALNKSGTNAALRSLCSSGEIQYLTKNHINI